MTRNGTKNGYRGNQGFGPYESRVEIGQVIRGEFTIY